MKHFHFEPRVQSFQESKSSAVFSMRNNTGGSSEQTPEVVLKGKRFGCSLHVLRQPCLHTFRFMGVISRERISGTPPAKAAVTHQTLTGSVSTLL